MFCREPYREVLTEKGLPVDNEKIGCTFALFTASLQHLSYTGLCIKF